MVEFSFSEIQKENDIFVSIGNIKSKQPWVNKQFFWHEISETFKDTSTNQYRTKDEIVSYIDSIITPIIEYYESNYKNYNVRYYINTETEILWMPFYKIHGVLDYLENKFKDKNLILMDGNLSDIKYDTTIKQEGVGVYWGQSSDINEQFDIDSREKFSKHFTCLQERGTRSRNEIYYHLYENNLFHKVYYTYQQRHKLSPYHFKLDDTTNYSYTHDEKDHTKIMGKSVLFFPNHWYKHAFCNIVTESSFYEEDLPGTTPTKIFFTEKIEKCFTAGQPFILVGNQSGLKYLKSIGFKTFDNWWDESYDEESNEMRMQKIKELISDISSWSLDKCYTIYKEMIPTLKHNQRLNKELYNSNTGPFFNEKPTQINCKQVDGDNYVFSK